MWTQSRSDINIIQGQTLNKTYQFLVDDADGKITVTDNYGVTHKCSIYSLSGYKAAAAVVSRLGTNIATMATTIDPAASKVTISLTDEVTAAISAGGYLWDLCLEDSSGNQQKPIYGCFNVTVGAVL